MNCEDIILNYLEENGYDGLVNIWLECGCQIGEIALCESLNLSDCSPAYKHHCDKCKIFPSCDLIDVLAGKNSCCFKKEKPDGSLFK
jgi:hypothetical protein